MGFALGVKGLKNFSENIIPLQVKIQKEHFLLSNFNNPSVVARLLPNRSPVAWGSQRIALGALIFHSNTFDFICWAPKFSAFSSEGPFKVFLGSSLGCSLVVFHATTKEWFIFGGNKVDNPCTCKRQ